MTLRVLAIDAGLTAGWGAVGAGRPPQSGSYRFEGGSRAMGKVGRAFDHFVRQLILREKPAVLAFAAPFVGRFASPDSIRPLMSMCTLLEMIGDELRLKCVEIDEPAARRAFLTKVPRCSKEIKIAVMEACFVRGWPAKDNHSADALVVASWALELLSPKEAHATTPLFQPKKRKATR